MADHPITAKPFLGGFERSLGDSALAEIDPLAVTHIAIARGSVDAFAGDVKTLLGTDPPAAGHAVTLGERSWLINSAPGQFLALQLDDHDPLLPRLTPLTSSAYLTEQSDHWVGLRLSGSLAHATLERVCPIDIHPTKFPIGAASHTLTNGIDCLILREGDDRFVLLSRSASAQSFLRMIETSLDYVS